MLIKMWENAENTEMNWAQLKGFSWAGNKTDKFLFAAVVAVAFSAILNDEPVTMKVDRPFYYAIVTQGAKIFEGSYRE